MHKPDFTPARELASKGQQLTTVDDTCRQLAATLIRSLDSETALKERSFARQLTTKADYEGQKLQIQLTELGAEATYHITLRRVK